VYIHEKKNASSEHTIFAYLKNQKKDELTCGLVCFDYSSTLRAQIAYVIIRVIPVGEPLRIGLI
jgi:hypothetical protein